MSNVVILLCTYQGERFLRAQIDSIIGQSYSSWKIIVSDDGSNDETLNILKDYQNRLGAERLKILHGPQKNFAANFLSLISRVEINAKDYYAYSDQDDIWQNDKLKRAVQIIESVPSNLTTLYCSRTQLIDNTDKPIGYSSLFCKKPSFANALVQSPFGGNTMVFNAATANMLQKICKDINNVPSHDWWTYLIVSGTGGKIFYDSSPSVLYRQHNDNLVGANASIRAKLNRVHKLFEGDFRNMINMNVQNMSHLYENLTPENQKILNLFIRGRQSKSPIFKRLMNMKQAGIYRLTLLGNLGLFTGILFNKV